MTAAREFDAAVAEAVAYTLSLTGAPPMFMHPDDGDGHLATEAEAHAEWHRNTGQRYGCPQDACWAPDPDPVPVQCALDRDHDWHEFGRPADVYCPGRFTHPAALGPAEPFDPNDLPF